jgi:shikimate kinase
LIGYRGSGKSTLAPLVAAKLGFSCVDTDQLLQEQLSEPLKVFFARSGEAEFRRLETQVVCQVSQGTNQVVSLGGGAILAQANQEAIRRTGRSVWLRCSLGTLSLRLTKDQSQGASRPSLTGLGVVEEIQAVLAVREPIYRDLADLILDADASSTEELSDRIVAWWLSQD